MKHEPQKDNRKARREGIEMQNLSPWERAFRTKENWTEQRRQANIRFQAKVEKRREAKKNKDE